MLGRVLGRASSRAAAAWTRRASWGSRSSRRGGVAAATAGACAAAAALGVTAAADTDERADSSQGLPTDKLACHADVAPPRTPAVLVSCGSFNPPTVAHLRMFHLATVALAERGVDVWGCYMSPVADSYGKQGLAPVEHRLAMCELAAADTPDIMVDAWEASQPGYTRTLQVLRHVSSALEAYMQQGSSSSSGGGSGGSDGSSGGGGQAAAAHAAGLHAAAARAGEASSSSSGGGGGGGGREPAAAAPLPRVILLCGADLLATMAEPGVWRDPGAILADHGVVCVARAGTDVRGLLDQPGSVLHEHRERVLVVEDPAAGGVSSSLVRSLLAAGQPVRYLVPDAVLSYIRGRGLYGCGAAGQERR